MYLMKAVYNLQIDSTVITMRQLILNFFAYHSYRDTANFLI